MHARPPALLCALALGCAAGLPGCAAPAAGRSPAVATSPEAEARAALDRFLAALDRGRWGEAHALLSARWRAALTPVQLGEDWRGAGPVGREAAARARAALDAGTALVPDGAGWRLPAPGERGPRLVAEPGGARVDALE